MSTKDSAAIKKSRSCMRSHSAHQNSTAMPIFMIIARFGTGKGMPSTSVASQRDSEVSFWILGDFHILIKKNTFLVDGSTSHQERSTQCFSASLWNFLGFQKKLNEKTYFFNVFDNFEMCNIRDLVIGTGRLHTVLSMRMPRYNPDLGYCTSQNCPKTLKK